MLQWIARLDAHERVFISVVVAAAVGLSLHHAQVWTLSLGAYDGFALSLLLLTLPTVVLIPASKIKEIARIQDAGRTIIFALVLLAACAALFAVGFIIRGGKAETQQHFVVQVLLPLVTVVLSWLIVHLTFGFRYAHRFYGDLTKERKGSGLNFPGRAEPDYRDFAYFSFVIGMTFQVSDVQIESRPMRQLALLHSILSFAFNTIILALTVNTVSSLLS